MSHPAASNPRTNLPFAAAARLRWGSLLILASVVAAMVGVTAVGANSAAAAGLTRASAGSGSACADEVGVTIIIDFQSLNEGKQEMRCASGSVTDGFDALTKAGFSYQQVLRQPGFLCKIDGLPAKDPCINTPPAGAYWSYWLAQRGGQWVYSDLGAGNRSVPPGSVEGWSFSTDRGSAATPPRRNPPPAVAAPKVPETTTTTASLAPAATAPITVTPRASEEDPAPAVSVQPDDPGTPDETVVEDAALALVEDDSAGEPDPGLVQTNPDRSEEALGNVDLTSNGSSGGAGIGGVLVAVVIVGALGGGAMYATKRRRSSGGV